MSAPYILAWELTKACNLKCRHCRASAVETRASNELTTAEGLDLLRQLQQAGCRMVILSGGEPLMRDDVFRFAAAGNDCGLRMTLATNGSMVDADTARRIRDNHIMRVSVSLDGTSPDVHDDFRGIPGAFEQALNGIDRLRQAGVPVQINTTVAAANIHQMQDFPALVKELGAVAWHVFFLVPTGRGNTLEAARINEYRTMLDMFYEVYQQAEIECKATCAPQFYRLLKQKGEPVKTKGCLAGTGFGFVSSTGDVQACGFFDVACGNIRQQPFSTIWENSELLNLLRQTDKLKGHCGGCGYQDVCGGCRARAHETLNDAMGTDPICWYANGH